MKNLTLVIHTNVQQDLADHLRSMEQISGFSFSHIEGHGVQVESDPFLSARDKVVGYTPRVRVDILLEDHQIEPILNSIRNTIKGIEGQGIFWVSPVEKSGQL